MFDLAFPSTDIFILSIKFYKLESINPEIKQYEINKNIIKIKDFKKEYSSEKELFDLFVLDTNSLVELDDDINISDVREKEIVIYESVKNNKNNLVFIYPFVSESDPGTTDRNKSTYFSFKLREVNKSTYPIRILASKHNSLELKENILQSINYSKHSNSSGKTKVLYVKEEITINLPNQNKDKRKKKKKPAFALCVSATTGYLAIILKYPNPLLIKYPTTISASKR